jgi:hypothetical protein
MVAAVGFLFPVARANIHEQSNDDVFCTSVTFVIFLMNNEDF